MSYTLNYNITCCNGCIAPKRHPGCHGHCPEYRKEKAEYEAHKAKVDKQKAIKRGLDSMAIAAVDRARKIREGRK